MDATVAQALLADLLSKSAAALTSPPTKQYVAHGSWAHDCECLVVSLADGSFEPLARALTPQIPHVVVEIVLLRDCWPTIDGDGVPASTETQTAALALAADFGALLGGLGDDYAGGSLFPTAGIGCTDVQFLSTTPIGPEGGIAGWRLRLAVHT